MLSLRLKLGDGWRQSRGVSVIGAGFAEDRLLTGESLVYYFSQVYDFENFVDKLQKLNGFFAVIVFHENECYAAVDRIRSIPLFYAVWDGQIFLSDDPEWIRSEIGSVIMDPMSVFEFLLTGYVTRDCTLDPHIRQIQAGEALAVRDCDGAISCKTMRYYRLFTGREEKFCLCDAKLLSELEEVTLAAIQRLICFADGRPIVIPLSGGLDSRLIAMTLKRLGYENVIAFSYGVRGNWEAQISHQIATQLKIPWHFVEYSRDRWKRWYWSEECQAYIKYASRLVSLAHLQDWPAVQELLFKKIIPEDAVIVPGHSADFVAGSHIPPELIRKERVNLGELVRSIIRHHYILMPPEIAAECAEVPISQTEEAIEERILRCLAIQGESAFSRDRAVSLYENWDWQERQAKYIANAVRVYDFFSLRWWLPWWDADFVSFWDYVPLRARIYRKLWKDYCLCIQGTLGVKVKESFGELVLAHAKEIARKVDKTGWLKQKYSAFITLTKRRRTPASQILALDGAFNMDSETHLSVLGRAALAQISLWNRSKSFTYLPEKEKQDL